ncbi:MAG: XdhC/CoxI family protein [Desulfobacteraceae bacterium]|nr:MAG: XdhC/CoxI family protein [Desulfobacteraceae bacterium]
MSEMYAKVFELLKEGRPVVLATITRLSGSGPRGVGANILVLDDGRTVGTIGGGLLEAKVMEQAASVLKTRLPTLMSLSLMGKDVEKTEMLCGGDVEVFLEPIFPENKKQVGIFEKAESILRRSGAAVVATLINPELQEEGAAPKMVIEKGGDKAGYLPIQRLEQIVLEQFNDLLRKRKPILVSYREKEGRELRLFITPLAADPIVYIFGGGHVSAQIVPLASHVDFRVVVIDDREEFADPRRFPEASEVLQMDFKGAVNRLPIDKASYMVIVTRGHAHDKSVLEQCLRSEAGYIGMIGSRRKRAIVYEKLLQEGFTKADLDRVHSPIGIEIGAETPEEIGVSIVAELIKIRAGVEEKKHGKIQ